MIADDHVDLLIYSFLHDSLRQVVRH
jgi:hypothetical protein